MIRMFPHAKYSIWRWFTRPLSLQFIKAYKIKACVWPRCTHSTKILIYNQQWPFPMEVPCRDHKITLALGWVFKRAHQNNRRTNQVQHWPSITHISPWEGKLACVSKAKPCLGGYKLNRKGDMTNYRQLSSIHDTIQNVNSIIYVIQGTGQGFVIRIAECTYSIWYQGCLQQWRERGKKAGFIISFFFVLTSLNAREGGQTPQKTAKSSNLESTSFSVSLCPPPAHPLIPLGSLHPSHYSSLH